MDLDALMRCLGTGSCVVTQLTSGMIIGMLLFLIASGVTLIFGVLNRLNIAHGATIMVAAFAGATICLRLGGANSYGVLVLALFSKSMPH